MSQYTDYIFERLGDEAIENRTGFCTYRYLNAGKSVYIVDIYVDPKYRKKGAAGALADKVVEAAKKRGAVELLGTVVPSTKNSTVSLDVLRGYDMELSSASQDMIVFRKEI